jgi:hypothetical protein
MFIAVIRPKKTSEFKNCTFEGTKYLHGQMWHPPAKRSSEIDCCVSCHCRVRQTNYALASVVMSQPHNLVPNIYRMVVFYAY